MNFCKDCVFVFAGCCGHSEVNRRPNKSICDNDYACEYFTTSDEINLNNIAETLHRRLEQFRMINLEAPRIVMNDDRIDFTFDGVDVLPF